MTRTIYVPGGPCVNRYDPRQDTVYLDENLRDYPVVHQHVRRHELQHAENAGGFDGFIRDVVHELRQDLFLFFSTSEEADAVRQYIWDVPCSSGTASISAVFGPRIGGMLRGLWQLPMIVAGYAYRLYRKRGSPRFGHDVGDAADV